MGKNESEISDLWSSILFNKTTTLIPPYIHPLSNNSSSTLSNKSLNICTESLCSETGSDDFSSSSNEKSPPLFDDFFNMKSKFGSQVTIPRPSRSIPPPLPSLAGGGSGRSSILVQSRRRDGRLILEAVSLPSSKSCFRAHRFDGRLLLRYATEEEEEEAEEKNVIYRE